jgi:hypothetical protein
MGNVILQINGEKYQIVNRNNIMIKPEIMKKVEDFVEFSNFIRDKSEQKNEDMGLQALSGAILEPYVLKITLNLDSKIIELDV